MIDVTCPTRKRTKKKNRRKLSKEREAQASSHEGVSGSRQPKISRIRRKTRKAGPNIMGAERTALTRLATVVVLLPRIALVRSRFVSEIRDIWSESVRRESSLGYSCAWYRPLGPSSCRSDASLPPIVIFSTLDMGLRSSPYIGRVRNRLHWQSFCRHTSLRIGRHSFCWWYCWI